MAKEKQELKVLEEPAISHNINLNMSASDLIELYIEENIEKVQSKMKKILDFLKIDKSEGELKLKLSAIASSYFKKLPFKVLSVYVNTNTVYLKQQIKIVSLNHSIRTHYKIEDVLKDKGQELSESIREFVTYKVASVTFKGVNDSTLTLRTADLPAELVKKLNKLLFVSVKDQKTKFEDEGKIAKDIFALVEEYRELSNRTKIKARFTKKALSQTEQGKGLLEFINSGKTLSLLD